MGFHDNAVFNWSCFGCGENIQKTVRWLKDNPSYDCPSCGVSGLIPPAERQRALRLLKQLDDIIDGFSGEFPPTKPRL